VNSARKEGSGSVVCVGLVIKAWIGIDIVTAQAVTMRFARIAKLGMWKV
jgi:hypothetical protein